MIAAVLGGAGVLPFACAVERERDPTAPAGGGVHPPGILDPASTDFHGALLASTGWDFETCRRCHGEDFGGGTSGVSCTSCHEEGPTACVTCHQDLLDSGAHAAHLGGTLDFDRCETCHQTPGVWSDPGHLDPAPPELTVAYDRETGACTVACHGSELEDPAAAVPRPVWTDTSGAAAQCGSCHGEPPGDGVHARDDCATCHQRVIDAEGAFVDAALHIDGIVEVGDGREGCPGCHGDEITSGAHRTHLEAPHRLSSRIDCTECHLVPSDVLSAGHIDSPPPVEVFAGPSPLASAHGADPTWDAETSTCRGVACHGGGGGRFAMDTAPDLRRTPLWTEPGVPTCGSCHGIPPLDGAHDPLITFRDCAGCHDSVGPYADILFTPDGRTRHLDGELDVR